MSTDDAVRLVAHRLEDGSLDPATLMGQLRRNTWLRILRTCPALCINEGCTHKAEPAPHMGPLCCCSSCHSENKEGPGLPCPGCPSIRQGSL